MDQEQIEGSAASPPIAEAGAPQAREGAAYRVACTRCSAAAGAPCRDGDKIRARAHNARGAAAREAAALRKKRRMARDVIKGQGFGFWGQVLQGARERRAYSKRQFAERIERTEGELSSWEPSAATGWPRRQLTERMMISIATACGVTLARLFEEHLLAIEPARYVRRSAKAAREMGRPENLGFLGACIQRARVAAGMTQGALGARMAPPSAQPAVHGWETSADGAMGEKTFTRIGGALGLTPEEMVAEELIDRGEIRRVDEEDA